MRDGRDETWSIFASRSRLKGACKP
jgi:hypothetical protein